MLTTDTARLTEDVGTSSRAHANERLSRIGLIPDMSRVTALVLAGGQGIRLLPLTRHRTKPEVRFGGGFRLIDFTLSNLVNGGVTRIIVAAQQDSLGLRRHLARTWPNGVGASVSITIATPSSPEPYSGSADALYRNLERLDDPGTDHVLVFGADHLYRVDPAEMVARHIASGADLTIGALPVPIEDASGFGIIDADQAGRIRSFAEKPSAPRSIPGSPHLAFASMGIYAFTTATLRRAVSIDAARPGSAHDVGGDIVPLLVSNGTAQVFDFSQSRVPGQSERERGYWRDLGTLDAYYSASMDVIGGDAPFCLTNEAWPIRAATAGSPSARPVSSSDVDGVIEESLVSPLAELAGGAVRRSILSPGSRVERGAVVDSSVVLDGAVICEDAIVRRAIVGEGAVVPRGAVIGVDPNQDTERFTVTPKGIVVVARDDLPEPGELPLDLAESRGERGRDAVITLAGRR